MLASRTAREVQDLLSAGSIPARSPPSIHTAGFSKDGRRPAGREWVSNTGDPSGQTPAPPHVPLTPAGPAAGTLPLPLPLASRHQTPAPRAHKPVFQASGACRSDVLTAQVAKATNTRHMSFWLKVNEVRGPRGTPRKEKHVLSSCRCPTQTHLPWDMSLLAMSVLRHVCLESHPPRDTG